METFDTTKIVQFILNPPPYDWLLTLKIIFIVVSLIFIGFIIFALVKTTWLKKLFLWDLEEFLTYRPYGMAKFEKKWQKIKERLASDTESEWKLSIIEADELINDTLSRMEIPGESLGEKLTKVTSDTLPNVEELKNIRKIRNSIIRDPTYKLSLEEAKRAMAVYEKALVDLQVL